LPPFPTYTQDPWAQTYDEIIDARSPAEFAEDRIPGAIDLPVLDNEERAKVGTIYKQVDPFEARKLGAALVSKNIARHLETHFIAKPKQYRPLIYCWRGGQRSRSFAAVLSQIGWRVTVVEGGYKTYRAYVRSQLADLPAQLTYRILAGATGSGKTRILHQMRDRGAQVLDLEGLAHHRGSILGQQWDDRPEPQPSQKYFESLLLQQLQRFDPAKSVWVESESNKIGRIYLPQSLWTQMKQSSGVEIEVPLASRIQWLLQEYPDPGIHTDWLKQRLERLKSRYGKQKLQQWYDWIDRGEGEAFLSDLLQSHYDRAYEQSLHRCYPNLTETLTLPDLSPSRIAELVERLEHFPGL
jgi:tRNA 2-selenouridine synthase